MAEQGGRDDYSHRPHKAPPADFEKDKEPPPFRAPWTRPQEDPHHPGPPLGPAPPMFGEPEPDQEFVPRPAPPPLGPESPFGPAPPPGGLDPLNPHPPRDLQPRHLPSAPFGSPRGGFGHGMGGGGGGGGGGGPPFG